MAKKSIGTLRPETNKEKEFLNNIKNLTMNTTDADYDPDCGGGGRGDQEQVFAYPAIPPFQFNEGELLDELRDYIENTYKQHYAKGIQVVEFIISNGETPDFLKGNVLKYIIRYGRKNGHDRKDILKAIHYAILLLNYHDTHHDEKD